ncbi:NAD(P)-dependent oxidoreductase [Pantoea allii]|uniref:D-3-phosphoglycerate dehydrogenase n=1 Tax=Pantoea allii TaxID=574096 RepID=A0ABS6VCF7_9GAMM|nr:MULTISPECIES: NAD(P)-dependent oxidoreductase [Pantoea]MBW1213773.1 hypothetical protein [Pantoea allii]MBW1251836.1 hypothetical protein [Pantoea allii]MBW1256984.1 hypothetical protein [Pantoea allii]MBW1260433.1 hypothetical protein [Pantoea allii]MBW1266061.1 hypothetical protein [Pantoea allii]
MESKEKVLIVDPVHKHLLSFLEENYDVTVKHPVTQEKLISVIDRYDMLVLRSGAKVDSFLLEKATNVHTIIRAGTGTDNIDLEKVHEKNIHFYNTPSTNARAVAELSFGMMHCLYRHILRAGNEIRDNIWDKKSLLGYELSNKKLGLVGFGSIGKEIADISAGYHMSIHCTVSDYSSERATELSSRNITLHSELNSLLAHCDIIVVCCPYNQQTRNLIDARELSLLGKQAVLINVARGGVVNESALYNALSENTFLGAASDVFEHERKPSPLFTLNNFIGTPHIGAMSHESQEKIAELIIDYLQHQQSSNMIKKSRSHALTN